MTANIVWCPSAESSKVCFFVQLFDGEILYPKIYFIICKPLNKILISYISTHLLPEAENPFKNPPYRTLQEELIAWVLTGMGTGHSVSSGYNGDQVQ